MKLSKDFNISEWLIWFILIGVILISVGGVIATSLGKEMVGKQTSYPTGLHPDEITIREKYHLERMEGNSPLGNQNWPDGKKDPRLVMNSEDEAIKIAKQIQDSFPPLPPPQNRFLIISLREVLPSGKVNIRTAIQVWENQNANNWIDDCDIITSQEFGEDEYGKFKLTTYLKDTESSLLRLDPSGIEALEEYNLMQSILGVN